MESLREVVAAVLSGTMPVEFPVDRWKQLARVALADESGWSLDTHNELQAAINVLQHSEGINVVIVNGRGQEVLEPLFSVSSIGSAICRCGLSTPCQVLPTHIDRGRHSLTLFLLMLQAWEAGIYSHPEKLT